MTPRRLIPALYWGLAAFQVAMVAMVFRLPVFPSQDGPMHLYYAGVFTAAWHNPAAYGGEFRIPFVVRPYSTLHDLLVALGAVFEPVTAEKVLVAGYIIGFAAAFLYLARSVGGRTPAVLLIVPFIMHRMVYLGFYNYCLGSAMALALIGFWIRHHKRLSGWRTVVYVLAVGLMLLTHPMSLLIATMFICLHLCAGFAFAFRAASGDVAARVRAAIHRLLRPLAHAALAVAATAYVSFFFGPKQGTPVEWPRLTSRLRMLMELDSLRPFNDLGIWSILSV